MYGYEDFCQAMDNLFLHAVSAVEALEVLTNKDPNYWEKIALEFTQKNENK